MKATFDQLVRAWHSMLDDKREKESCLQVLITFVSFLGPPCKLLPNTMVQLCTSKLRVHFTSILSQECTHTVIKERNFDDMMRQWRVLHSSSIPSLCLQCSIASSPRTVPLVHQCSIECLSLQTDSSILQRDVYHLRRGSSLLRLSSLVCTFVTFARGREAPEIFLRCLHALQSFCWFGLESNPTTGKVWRNASSETIFLTYAYVSLLALAIILKRLATE